MRCSFPSLVGLIAVGLWSGPVAAMPIGPASSSGVSPLVVKIAEGCGPGLVRGRRGTCLRRRAVFARSGRILHKGCGKPIGAGLRTPC